MRLLTTQAIAKAALAGDIEALRCSVTHWNQLRKLTYRQYLELNDMGKIGMGTGYCAVCLRHECDSCPLWGSETGITGCCGGYYGRAHHATAGEWKRTTTDVYNYIKKVLERKLDEMQ